MLIFRHPQDSQRKLINNGGSWSTGVNVIMVQENAICIGSYRSPVGRIYKFYAFPVARIRAYQITSIPSIPGGRRWTADAINNFKNCRKTFLGSEDHDAFTPPRRIRRGD